MKKKNKEKLKADHTAAAANEKDAEKKRSWKKIERRFTKLAVLTLIWKKEIYLNIEV